MLRSYANGLEFLAMDYILYVKKIVIKESRHFFPLTMSTINISTWGLNGNLWKFSQIGFLFIGFLIQFLFRRTKGCFKMSVCCTQVMVQWAWQKVGFPEGKVWELVLSGGQGQVNLHSHWLSYTVNQCEAGRVSLCLFCTQHVTTAFGGER